MPQYKVLRSHYNGRFSYKGGDDFPADGDKLPAEPELKDKLRRKLIVEVNSKASKSSDKTDNKKAQAKNSVDATEDDVVAYLKGLEPKPEAKPKVGDVSKAMEKKVGAKVLDLAWKTFTAASE